MTTPPGSRLAPRFRTTQWSLVVRAASAEGSGQQAALADLCRAYWYPVYVFIRRRGFDAGESEDLTQDFFSELLDKRGLLETADPTRGRFRTYLLAGVKHHLSKHRRRQAAEQRGGKVHTLSVDWMGAEQRYATEPVDGWTADAIFHRRWALTLLEQVLARLSEHYAAHGRGEWFERLRPYLTTDDQPAYADLAETLGTTPSAVRVAVHRLRKHYREALEAEIRSTVGESDSTEDERAELWRALGGA
jgi:RNA polymerase sigma-70 factor (ECF subfamily)